MGSPRRRTLSCKVLGELTDQLLSYLDMREGRGNEEHPRTDDTIWDQLDEVQQALLCEGLGPTYIAEFYEQAQGLQDTSGELHELIDTIRRRY
jgi:hypothetical protein